MQGVKRRVVYVALYETIAVSLLGPSLAALSGRTWFQGGTLAVACSVVAVLWNLTYNTLFEAWEARQSVRGRSVARRVAHAVGFECGLILMLVPLFSWWLEVSLWQALLMNIGMSMFFVVYTYVFSWTFDRLFGLPASALPVDAEAGV